MCIYSLILLDAHKQHLLNSIHLFICFDLFDTHSLLPLRPICGSLAAAHVMSTFNRLILAFGSAGVVLLHERLEGLVEAGLEAELCDDLLWNIGHIQQNRHEIALLTVVLVIIIVVLDQLVAFWHITTHVLEVSIVQRVCQHVVVRDACNGFLRSINCIESLRHLPLNDSESIVIMEVIVFLKQPVSIFEFECGKEEGKIFIHIQRRSAKCEAPLFKLLIEESLQKYDNQDCCAHKKHG